MSLNFVYLSNYVNVNNFEPGSPSQPQEAVALVTEGDNQNSLGNAKEYYVNAIRSDNSLDKAINYSFALQTVEECRDPPLSLIALKAAIHLDVLENPELYDILSNEEYHFNLMTVGEIEEMLIFAKSRLPLDDSRVSVLPKTFNKLTEKLELIRNRFVSQQSDEELQTQGGKLGELALVATEALNKLEAKSVPTRDSNEYFRFRNKLDVARNSYAVQSTKSGNIRANWVVKGINDLSGCLGKFVPRAIRLSSIILNVKFHLDAFEDEDLKCILLQTTDFNLMSLDEIKVTINIANSILPRSEMNGKLTVYGLNQKQLLKELLSRVEAINNKA